MINTLLPGQKLCKCTTNAEEGNNFILIFKQFLTMVHFWNWTLALPDIDKELEDYVVANGQTRKK